MILENQQVIDKFKENFENFKKFREILPKKLINSYQSLIKVKNNFMKFEKIIRTFGKI